MLFLDPARVQSSSPPTKPCFVERAAHECHGRPVRECNLMLSWGSGPNRAPKCSPRKSLLGQWADALPRSSKSPIVESSDEAVLRGESCTYVARESCFVTSIRHISWVWTKVKLCLGVTVDILERVDTSAVRIVTEDAKNLKFNDCGFAAHWAEHCAAWDSIRIRSGGGWIRGHGATHHPDGRPAGPPRQFRDDRTVRPADLRPREAHGGPPDPRQLDGGSRDAVDGGDRVVRVSGCDGSDVGRERLDGPIEPVIPNHERWGGRGRASGSAIDATDLAAQWLRLQAQGLRAGRSSSFNRSSSARALAPSVVEQKRNEQRSRM